MSTIRHNFIIFVGLGLLMLPMAAAARVGLMAQFADDVVLENLSPGEAYNLRTMGHLPYIVTNTCDADVDVVIDVNIPEKNQLKPGYEALGDPSWVKVMPNTFRLKPGEQGVSEIIIMVPNDTAYVNKSYQLDIYSHTKALGLLGAGALHRLRFSIGKGPETLAAEKKHKAMMSLECDVSPLSVFVAGVQPGKMCDVKEEKGASLKLTNKGSKAIKIKPISVQFSMGIMPYQGYEKAPDVSWLTFKPDVVKVGELSIKEVKMFIKVPDDPKYYGKKYAFLVKSELQGTEVPLEMYNQVLVTVQQAAGK